MDFSLPSSELPFQQPGFTGSHFEAFCGQLLAPGFRVSLADRTGKPVAYEIAKVWPRKAPGVAQGGRDFGADTVLLTPAGRSDAPAERWFFECKHRAEIGTYTLADANAAVRACPSTEAARKFLLVSHAFTETERFEQTNPTWELWDSRRLHAQVLELKSDRAALLLHRCFGADWVKRLVPDGAANAPLLSAAAFFEAPLRENSLLFHGKEFLGPATTALDQLIAQLADPAMRIIPLLGGGGTGKSRLLLEIARRLESSAKPRRVLFVNPNAPPSAIELAYYDRHALLVLDDAHLWPDERIRALGAAKRITGVQLILATRPHLANEITYDTRRADFDPSEIAAPIEVPSSWPTADIRTLLHALQPALPDDDIRHLVSVSDGSPLVATLAARLIAKKGITLSDLANSTVFRDEVFLKFARYNFAPLTQEAPEAEWWRLSQMLAALSPLKFSPEVTAGAAEFLELGLDVVHQRIERLTSSGLVQSSGEGLRVWPDVFADFLVHHACVTPKLGVTPFAHKLRECFSWEKFPSLLRNLALAAWRVAQTNPTDSHTITTGLVAEFRETFDRSSWMGRSSLVSHWSNCAYFLPDDTLDLVEHALSLTDAPDEEDPIGQRGRDDQIERRSWMLDRLPPLLGVVASYYPGRRQTRALDLLWSLRHQRRGPRFLGLRAPREQLADVVLAGLKHHPDVVRGAWAWVRQMIAQELADGGAAFLDRDPVLAELLTPFIARKARDNYDEGDTVHIRDLLVLEPRTRELRQEVFAFAEEIAAHPNPRIAFALLPFLRKATAPGIDRIGARHDPDSDWLPDRLRAVAIARAMLKHHAHPALHFAVRRFLHESFYYEDVVEFHDAVKTVLSEVRESLERDLLMVCAGGPADFAPDTPMDDVEADYQNRQLDRHRQTTLVAQRIVGTFPAPSDFIARLRSLVTEAESFGFPMAQPEIGSALRAVAPDYALKLAESLVNEGNRTVDWLWSSLLANDSPTDDWRTQRLRIAQAACTSGRASLVASVIFGFARWLRRQPVNAAEAQFVLSLASSTGTTHASDWICALDFDSDSPLEIWTEVVRQLPDLPPDAWTLRNALYLIVSLTKLPADETRRGLLRELLNRLVTAPALGDTANFALGEASKNYFDDVMEFLAARLERMQNTGRLGDGYEVIPHQFNSLPPPVDQPTVMRWQARLWPKVLARKPWDGNPAHRLFRKAFGRSIQAYEDFLSTQASQATSVNELKAIAEVLRQRTREPMPWLPTLIRQVLVTARTKFPSDFNSVEESLLSACVPSSWGFVNGRPDDDTRVVLENLRRLRVEWAHESSTARFFDKAIERAEARTRYR